MTPRGPVARLIALALALALAAPIAAARGPSSRRRVAVLEFRGGARGASGAAGRVAAILRRATSLAIVDQDDARRVAGAGVDDEIARCRGEARCVGAVGRRLKVDEVILVGVSEFGDLILALQRVSVRDGEVLARVAESLPAGAEPDDAALTGYVQRLLPPEDFRRFGTVRVRANVAGATVWVDGRRRGVTPLPPVQVPAPSRIDVRIAKSGYQEFLAHIQVPPDATVEVRPVLQRRGERLAWYRRPWVWAVLGGVATGAAAGGVLLTRPETTHVPVTLEW